MPNIEGKMQSEGAASCRLTSYETVCCCAELPSQLIQATAASVLFSWKEPTRGALGKGGEGPS